MPFSKRLCALYSLIEKLFACNISILMKLRFSIKTSVATESSTIFSRTVYSLSHASQRDVVVQISFSHILKYTYTKYWGETKVVFFIFKEIKLIFKLNYEKHTPLLSQI